MPTISLKTVYQTVHDLEALGEVRRARPRHRLVARRPERRGRRTTTSSAPSCGRVRDLPVEFDGLRVPPRYRRDFTVDDVQVIFRGRCDALRDLTASIDRQPNTTDIDQPQGAHPDAQAERNARRTRTSRKPSPARARRTAATSTSRRRPTSRVTPTLPRCSARSPKVRPATRSVTSTSSPRSATRSPALPSAAASDNLKSAVAGETYEYTEMYPGFAKHRARRRLRRGRGVARDAGPRREESRRSLPGRRSSRSADRRLTSRRPRAHAGSLSADGAPPLRSARSRRSATRADTRVERDRTFHICSDCRICVKLCPSFRSLFEMIDDLGGSDETANLTDAAAQARRRRVLPVQALLRDLPVHAGSAAGVARRLPAADAAVADRCRARQAKQSRRRRACSPAPICRARSRRRSRRS